VDGGEQQGWLLSVLDSEATVEKKKKKKKRARTTKPYLMFTSKACCSILCVTSSFWI
jgi:hypothetical protein